MSVNEKASLAELQRAFAALTTQRESTLTAEQLVFGAGTLTAAEGIEVYANMFVWRQVDSLLEDFPKLAAVTGEAFYELCQAYVRAHPSRHHSLARLGQSLPSFLAAHQGMRPDLSDLAALEWARNEVFEEAMLPTAAAPEAADDRLCVVPALRSLWLQYDVTAVWSAVERGSAVPEPRRYPSCIVVWRRDFDIYHVRLEPLEAAAWARATSHASLTEICETFAEQLDSIQVAARVIGSWFSEGWIAQGAL